MSIARLGLVILAAGLLSTSSVFAFRVFAIFLVHLQNIVRRQANRANRKEDVIAAKRGDSLIELSSCICERSFQVFKIDITLEIASVGPN